MMTADDRTANNTQEYYEIDGVAAEAGGRGGAGVSVTRVAAGGRAGAASWSWSGTPAAG